MAARNLTRDTELARSIEPAHRLLARMRGLLGRDGLEAGAALWIWPCNSIHTIGMHFPIDAVFLDGDGCVLRVYSELAPGRVTRIVRGARGVLELEAGAAERSGTQPGDLIAMELDVASSGPRR